MSITAPTRGEQLALHHECPRCGAMTGAWCRKVNNGAWPAQMLHISRVQLITTDEWRRA